jgi:hypothetical protein
MLTKYSWVVQFISHDILHLKVSFEITLGPLDFNIVLEPLLGCWTNLSPIMVHVFG